MEATLIYRCEKDGSFTIIAMRTDGETLETRNIFALLSFIRDARVTKIIHAEAL